MPRMQNKGFFGDLLGSVLQPAGALLGGLSSAVGIPSPIGAAAGGFLGDQAAGLARRIPFVKGGMVPMMPIAVAKVMKNRNKKGAKKCACPTTAKKGTTAMKKKMMKVRAAKKK